jgi:hypothetical protein
MAEYRMYTADDLTALPDGARLRDRSTRKVWNREARYTYNGVMVFYWQQCCNPRDHWYQPVTVVCENELKLLEATK